MRWLVAVCGLALVVVVLPGVPAEGQPDNRLSITFAAVNHGDGTVYRGPCGEIGVFDTPKYQEQKILTLLDHYGSRDLAWIAGSHYHVDHIGGLPGVASADGVSVDRVYDRGGGGGAYDSPTYRRYHAWATSAAVDRRPLQTGDRFSLCAGEQEVTFEVLSAGRGDTARGGTRVVAENDKSLCLRVSYRDFSHATCGDLNGTDVEYRTDMESVVAPAMGSVDVVQANHHGSVHSSNETWVHTLDPAVVVVSRGANPVGPLHPEVVRRWHEVGAAVFRTQDINNERLHGDITVATTGRDRFTVTTSSGVAEAYPVEPAGNEDNHGPGAAAACPLERVLGGEGAGLTDRARDTLRECL